MLSDQSLHHPLCIQCHCSVDKLREGVYVCPSCMCAPHVHVCVPLVCVPLMCVCAPHVCVPLMYVCPSCMCAPHVCVPLMRAILIVYACIHVCCTDTHAYWMWIRVYYFYTVACTDVCSCVYFMDTTTVSVQCLGTYCTVPRYILYSA